MALFCFLFVCVFVCFCCTITYDDDIFACPMNRERSDRFHRNFSVFHRELSMRITILKLIIHLLFFSAKKKTTRKKRKKVFSEHNPFRFSFIIIFCVALPLPRHVYGELCKSVCIHTKYTIVYYKCTENFRELFLPPSLVLALALLLLIIFFETLYMYIRGIFSLGKHSGKGNKQNSYNMSYTVCTPAKVAMTNTLSSVEMSFKNIISVQCTEDSNLLSVKKEPHENRYGMTEKRERDKVPPPHLSLFLSFCLSLCVSASFYYVCVCACFFSWNAPLLWSFIGISLIFFHPHLYSASRFGLFNFELSLRQLLLLYFFLPFCFFSAELNSRAKYFHYAHVSFSHTSHEKHTHT